MNFKIENGLLYVEAWVNKIINVPNNMSFKMESQEELRLATIHEIESIFKGGKNTLTKIGNKEVQSVQDEKGMSVSDIDKHILKIDENQKIVDKIIKEDKEMIADGDTPDTYDLTINSYVKEVTGKYIKDL